MSLEIKERKWKLLSRVQLFVTPWSIVHGILQARILEWVAYPFSRGSFQPRDRTGVFCIAGGFFTSWATGKPKKRTYLTSFLLMAFPTRFTAEKLQISKILQSYKAEKPEIRIQNCESSCDCTEILEWREPEKGETKNLHLMVPKILA